MVAKRRKHLLLTAKFNGAILSARNPLEYYCRHTTIFTTIRHVKRFTLHMYIFLSENKVISSSRYHFVIAVSISFLRILLRIQIV